MVSKSRSPINSWQVLKAFKQVKRKAWEFLRCEPLDPRFARSNGSHCCDVALESHRPGDCRKWLGGMGASKSRKNAESHSLSAQSAQRCHLTLAALAPRNWRRSGLPWTPPGPKLFPDWPRAAAESPRAKLLLPKSGADSMITEC